MKKIKSLLILLLCSGIGAYAQTAYNPFTQNIHFTPEPIAAGFPCNSTQTVVFTQGLTTAANANLWFSNPLTVTICVTGFQFVGSPASIVSGTYASNFNWSIDPFAPNCLVGTQNQPLHGVGTNPLFPDPLSSGTIAVTLHVPETSPIGTVLAVNVNLQVPGYMQAFNSAPDDNESTQTQTYCPLLISGTVYNDQDNDADVDGFPISTADGVQLYANLLDSVGTVIAVVAVDAAGNYQFSVNPYTTYAVSVGTIPGTIGQPAPPTTITGAWIHTGEDCCDQVGNDGIVNGITAVSVTNFRKIHVDFGIKDPNAFNVPLVLKNFFVSEINCSALVSWTTLQEINTSHVEIYRRSEMDPAFKMITIVPGAGNSNQTHTYSYTDQTVESNETYEYKLRFVDIDKQYTESDIRSLNLECDGMNNTINVFPNPAKDELSMLYVSATDQVNLEVKLVDITGRSIETRTEVLKSGANIIHFDLSQVAAGHYMVRYTDGETLTHGVLKFVKQ
ncbi:MAG TPA: T9SS type A sorting domain-containing protein [Chitinophagaceae bacterium]|nr:T9SS type A sorting domain-containing protein [Chitinophagaceae bacterium]